LESTRAMTTIPSTLLGGGKFVQYEVGGAKVLFRKPRKSDRGIETVTSCTQSRNHASKMGLQMSKTSLHSRIFAVLLFSTLGMWHSLASRRSPENVYCSGTLVAWFLLFYSQSGLAPPLL
jgi:hypothetical protein